MLDAIDRKIDDLMKEPEKVRPHFGKFLSIWGLTTVAAGVAFPTLGVADAFAGTLMGIVGGMGTGLIYDVGLVEKRQAWKDSRHNAKQLKYIVPHEHVINALKKQINEDRIEITSVTNADHLKKSAVLKKVVDKYPRLIDVFRNAQAVQGEVHIPRVVANNNAPPADPKTLQL